MDPAGRKSGTDKKNGLGKIMVPIRSRSGIGKKKSGTGKKGERCTDKK